MGLIFAASAQPELPSAGVRWLDIVLKKAGHGLGYGVLGWLYMRALRDHTGSREHARFLSVGMASAMNELRQPQADAMPAPIIGATRKLTLAPIS